MPQSMLEFENHGTRTDVFVNPAVIRDTYNLGDSDYIGSQCASEIDFFLRLPDNNLRYIGSYFGGGLISLPDQDQPFAQMTVNLLPKGLLDPDNSDYSNLHIKGEAALNSILNEASNVYTSGLTIKTTFNNVSLTETEDLPADLAPLNLTMFDKSDPAELLYLCNADRVVFSGGVDVSLDTITSIVGSTLSAGKNAPAHLDGDVTNYLTANGWNLCNVKTEVSGVYNNKLEVYTKNDVVLNVASSLNTGTNTYWYFAIHYPKDWPRVRVIQ